MTSTRPGLQRTRAHNRRRGPGGHRRDRGAITVEVLLYAPLLALFLFTVIQTALWGAALVAARAAADGAARDAAAYNANPGEAQTAANDRLESIAGHLLGDPTITVQRDATTATVTVRGSSSLIPLPVSWTSTRPVERFTVGG